MANEKARRLRKRMTRHEVKLWLHLRELRKQGYHFRRQAPIDGFIVDFACYHPKLIIEIDGSQHARCTRNRRDASRDKHLAASGFGVLRFWNKDVDENLEGVLTLILHALQSDPPTPATPKSVAVPPR
jgi:very-short-patch-repair endonuclease